MSRPFLFGLSSLIVAIAATPVQAQVVDMDANGTATCQYLKRQNATQLVCNILATQTFANGIQNRGVFGFNCQSGSMAAKDVELVENGQVTQQSKGWTQPWNADTQAEKQFISNTCSRFETMAGGSDGLLADSYYFWRWEGDKLVCRSTKEPQTYFPPKRCVDAKTPLPR
jgi:hypothetical protein